MLKEWWDGPIGAVRFDQRMAIVRWESRGRDRIERWSHQQPWLSALFPATAGVLLAGMGGAGPAAVVGLLVFLVVGWHNHGRRLLWQRLQASREAAGGPDAFLRLEVKDSLRNL